MDLGQAGTCQESGRSLVVCINYNYPGPSLADQVADWAQAGAFTLLAVMALVALVTLLRARTAPTKPGGGDG